MNARHVKSGFFVSILTVLTMLAGLLPATAAQGNSGAVLATQFFAAIGDEAAAYQLSADAVLHTPGGDYVGRAGLSDFRTDLEASFSDLAFATQAAAQAGDLVIVAFTLTGINTGMYQELAANCAGFAVPGVAMLRLSEEIVVEQWIDYDADAIARQIAAFNALDSSVRPGCDDHVVAEETPGSDLPPVPTSPHDGRAPY